MQQSRVLVTGADGYIGSVLTSTLITRGFDVTGLDCGFYRNGWLYNASGPRPQTLTRDIRQLTVEDVKGFDFAVHLAELSNDPLSELNPAVTHMINHEGSVHFAQLCKAAGVARFVYTSSCSVYGAADDGTDRNEESAPNPQTTYARCKLLVERDVGALADGAFSPVFLRNATAFGASPRMRFDIVLNNLAGVAWTSREIRMTSDGTPWRPLVHVADICAAIAAVLEAPRDAVHNEIFNVGDDGQNYRISEIAGVIADMLPSCPVRFGAPGGDNRSYRTSFAKIHRHLPEFHCRWSAQAGARQLLDIFERIGLTAEMFAYPAYTRLEQLKHLIGTGQVTSDLLWNPLPAPFATGHNDDLPARAA